MDLERKKSGTKELFLFFKNKTFFGSESLVCLRIIFRSCLETTSENLYFTGLVTVMINGVCLNPQIHLYLQQGERNGMNRPGLLAGEGS